MEELLSSPNLYSIMEHKTMQQLVMWISQENTPEISLQD